MEQERVKSCAIADFEKNIRRIKQQWFQIFCTFPLNDPIWRFSFFLNGLVQPLAMIKLICSWVGSALRWHSRYSLSIGWLQRQEPRFGSEPATASWIVTWALIGWSQDETCCNLSNHLMIRIGDPQVAVEMHLIKYYLNFGLRFWDTL